jgi:hypothetical protein
MNKLRENKKMRLETAHVKAAIDSGFLRECCQRTLICPDQIPSRIDCEALPVAIEKRTLTHNPVIIRAASMERKDFPKGGDFYKPQKYNRGWVPGFSIPGGAGEPSVKFEAITRDNVEFKVHRPPSYHFPTFDKKIIKPIPTKTLVFPKRVFS